jgi:membrane-bound metal-dependent hydrolase YbcI (DUF457 family)
MANRKTHTVAGAVVGGLADLGWQIHRIYDSPQPPRTFAEAIDRINFFELGAFVLVGGFIFGCLPDILEPATNPRHRGFFHSFSWGSVITWGAFGGHSEEWPSKDRGRLRCLALSYLSHLYLDFRTPFGLPFI